MLYPSTPSLLGNTEVVILFGLRASSLSFLSTSIQTLSTPCGLNIVHDFVRDTSSKASMCGIARRNSSARMFPSRNWRSAKLQLRQFWFQTFLGHPVHFLQLRVVRLRECSHFSPRVICAFSWEPQLPILPPKSCCGCYRHSTSCTVRCLCVIPFWSSFSIIFLNQVASTFSEQTIASRRLHSSTHRQDTSANCPSTR